MLATLAALCVLGVVLSGCTNTGTTSPDVSVGVGTQQVVKASTGPTCTLEQYKGSRVDLKHAIVGFSQSEKEDNPFRIAETQSIKTEAARLGVKKLIATNAQSTLSKQIADIQDLIAQGAQILIVAPLNSDGLEPALNAARAKNIPVFTIDRKLDSTPCADYVSFLGSDFVSQGKRAADQLIAATGGKGKIAVLLGASGNGVTTDRTSGFVDEIKSKGAGLSIVAEQTGNFDRATAQTVTEQLLQSHPQITAIFAENDEMGLGAQAAVIGDGRTPGKDVRIFSIDGTRNAVQQIVAGAYNGVIESNPRFGPLAFATIQSFETGAPVSQNIVIEDSEYDPSNAASKVGSTY